MKIPDLEAWKK